MKTKSVSVLAVLLGTTGLPVYWVLAGQGHERQTTYTIAGVELQLAEARCALARQQLALARSRQRSAMLTAVYEEAVESFESELVDLKAGRKRDSFDHLLDEIKHLSHIAARRIEVMDAATAKNPGVVDDAELALLRATHDILRLGAAQGELLRSAAPQEKIDWQFEQLWTIQLLVADQLFDDGM